MKLNQQLRVHGEKNYCVEYIDPINNKPTRLIAQSFMDLEDQTLWLHQFGVPYTMKVDVTFPLAFDSFLELVN